jgi:peroxiredoxin
MVDLDFEVVDLGPADHPTEGEQAPDFTRPLVNEEYWNDVSLSALLDRGPVVLLFHPMDGAFPSTYTWNEIRDRGWSAFAPTVAGLSISTPYEHKRFIEERGIDHALFADPRNGVAEAYGIVNDLDGMAGIAEPRPAAFVIDAEGTIQYAWAATEWPEFPDYDAIEAAIDAL